MDVTDPVEVEQQEKKKKSKRSKKDGEPGSSTATEPSTSSSTAVATPSATPSPELPTTTTPTPSEISAYLSKHSITISGDAVPVLSFDQLTLHPKLRAALNGFKEPTPIQACAWPALMNGKDVIGIAETGSGKTLAFGLPALSRLVDNNTDSNKKKGPDVSVLVVAPTRELAIQTHDTLLALGEPFGILSVCLFGGMDKGAQKKSLQGSKGEIVRIVVGTPGRILDLLNEGALDLSKVTYLVLDEADRMLDKGFENDIRAIIGTTAESSKRQTLMLQHGQILSDD
ncbi:RNA-dependent ATPase [Tulasnella sp. 418]|nr:RNA-dependent ATPase [Tulasnella sp. 418]